MTQWNCIGCLDTWPLNWKQTPSLQYPIIIGVNSRKFRTGKSLLKIHFKTGTWRALFNIFFQVWHKQQCSKALQAPSFGRGYVIPITVPHSKISVTLRCQNVRQYSAMRWTIFIFGRLCSKLKYEMKY